MVDREVALGATQRAGRNVSMSDVAAAAGGLPADRIPRGEWGHRT